VAPSYLALPKHTIYINPLLLSDYAKSGIDNHTSGSSPKK